MKMAVDQARDEDFPRAVYDPSSCGGAAESSSNLRDPPAPDQHVRPIEDFSRAIHGDDRPVRGEQVHRLAGRTHSVRARSEKTPSESVRKEISQGVPPLLPAEGAGSNR